MGRVIAVAGSCLLASCRFGFELLDDSPSARADGGAGSGAAGGSPSGGGAAAGGATTGGSSSGGSGGLGGSPSVPSICPTIPEDGDALLAEEDFANGTGLLHDWSTGFGWAEDWRVQQADTVTPGFEVRSDSPMSYLGLDATASYAVGGRLFYSAGRLFDASEGGPFDSLLLTDGQVGAPGTDLWVSFMVRKDVDNGDAAHLVLHDELVSWLTNGDNLDVIRFGLLNDDDDAAPRLWSLTVGDSGAIETEISVVTGQLNFLVGRVCFGSEATEAYLFVNPPSLSSPPSSPDVFGRSSSPLGFSGIGIVPGNGPEHSSFDAIRLGTSFAAVTPN